jgi:transposase-like protein
MSGSVYPPAMRIRAVELAATGLGHKEVAKKLGVPYATVGRWLHPEWAAKERASSREAKRRRTGVCLSCGGETRYNGRTVNGPSARCASCARSALGEDA